METASDKSDTTIHCAAWLCHCNHVMEARTIQPSLHHVMEKHARRLLSHPVRTSQMNHQGIAGHHPTRHVALSALCTINAT